MLMRIWSNRNSYSLLVGMKNGTVTLEGNLRIFFFYKGKHALTIKSSNCTSWYLLKWVENLCPDKNLHMVVYHSFLHSCPNLKVTKMPFSRWMDKYTVVPSDSGILFSTKKRCVIKPWIDTRILKNFFFNKMKEANLKRLHTVGFQHYDILEKAKLWKQ